MRRIFGVFSLLLLLAAGASALVGAGAHVLSIQGEGTASVFLDEALGPERGRTAYITDGGQGGRLGLGGALIESREVLQYLLDEGVTRLVIACSHPHSDHMAGLKAAIRDPRIRQFRSIVFIDNGYDKREALYEYYRTKWGDSGGPKVTYSSAANRDAFAGLAEPGSAVRVSNFVYDPTEIPPSPGEDPVHGRSMITQYEIAAEGATLRAVDFDDASSPLLAKWAGRKPPPRLKVLISAHHGSVKNDMAPILAQKKQLGLKAVVFTANRENRHDHPSPDVLLKFIEELGADNVFVTDSTPGQNVELTSRGVKVESKEAHREQLASFIEARIEEQQGRARTILERVRARARGRVTLTASLRDSLEDGTIDEIAQLGLFEKKEEAGLRHSVQSVRTLDEALSKVKEEPRRDRAALALSLASLTLPPKAGGGAPDGDPGIQRYRSKYEEIRAEGGHSTSDSAGIGRGPTGGSGGGGGMFVSMLALPMPAWGGVILGNRPDPGGLRPVRLDFSAPADDDGGVPAFGIRAVLADGRTLDYSDVTPTELWAAYQFVQPGEGLERLHGPDASVPGNAAGLVGMTENHDDYWDFAIHPAIANTSLARDAMRLDMMISHAHSIAGEEGYGALPDYLRHITWESLVDFSTYQWYDAPARIRAAGGRLVVEAPDEPTDCLMRVRLVWLAHPPDWYSSQGEDESNDEFSRRLAKKVPSFGVPEESLAPYEQSVEEEMSKELEKGMESDFSLNPSLGPICHSFDALQSIDRLARLVAILNWYREESGQPLPPLPPAVLPVQEAVPASWSSSAVFAAGTGYGKASLVRLDPEITPPPIESPPEPEPDPGPEPKAPLVKPSHAVLATLVLLIGLWLWSRIRRARRSAHRA